MTLLAALAILAAIAVAFLLVACWSACRLAAMADDAADEAWEKIAHGDSPHMPLGSTPGWVGEQVHGQETTRG